MKRKKFIMQFSRKQYRKSLINIGLLTAGFIIAIGIAEIALRLGGFSLKKEYLYPLHYYKAAGDAGFDHSIDFPSTQFCVDANCFQIWTNELGCFDKGLSDVKDNIMLVGDSFTWGFASYEDIYGTGVENLIGKRVLKCGVGSYGTRQQLLKAERIHKKLSAAKDFRTELIILGYFWNDWLDDYTFPNSTVIEGYAVQSVRVADWKSGQLKVTDQTELQRRYEEVKAEKESRVVRTWLIDNSILYNYLRNLTFLRNIFVRLGIAKQSPSRNAGQFKYYSLPFYGYLGESPSWITEAWNGHIGNIRDMKRFAITINAKLLVVLIPDKTAVYEYIQNRAAATDDFELTNIEQPHRNIRDALAKEEVEYLDLLPELRKYADQAPKKALNFKKDFYYPYDPHMSPRGQRLTALLVSEYIVQNDLVDTLLGKEITLRKIKEVLSQSKWVN